MLAVLTAAAAGQDWPQFLGPQRNGVYPAALPGASPSVVWKKDVGQGFAGPVVARGKLILFHRQGNRETVECLDAKTGRRIWSYDYPSGYRDDFGFDEGPRGTPAIAGDRVYTFGAEGALHCVDLATGKKVWSVETHQKFGVRKGFFGAAASPLVEGDRVLINVGGTKGAGIVAFHKDTGQVLWTATNDEAGYSSPTAVTLGGARHALFLTRAGLVDLDPASGQVRFQFPWRSRSQASVNAATPVLVGENQVFLSASYGTGAVLLEIPSLKKLWSSDERLSCHYATPVLREGYLYGFHGRQEEGQSLRAVEARTGKVAWKQDGFGAGTVALAGDGLVVVRENGEVVVAPASPAGWKPAGSARVLGGVVRAYPALADGLLYARNETTLVCVRFQ
jgi:outer membrane protein assembly factor BamB